MKINLFISVREVEDILEIMNDFNRKKYFCHLKEVSPGRFELDDYAQGDVKLTIKSLELLLNAPCGLYSLIKDNRMSKDEKFRVELKKVKGFWVILK